MDPHTIASEQVEELDRLIQEFARNLHAHDLGYWSEKLHGINGIDLRLLDYLTQRADWTIKELTQVLKLPNSTATSAIDRLEAQKLARRVINKKDRRSYCVRVTQRGQDIHKEHLFILRLLATVLLDAISTHDKRQLFIELFSLAVNRLGEMPANSAEDLRDKFG